MYSTKIGAKFTFEEITNRIQGEEADGFVFVGCVIRNGAKPNNELSFNDHPSGGRPARCTVLAATATAPAAHRAEWVGQMLVQNNVRNVVLYRPK
ncbi:MULTISPECIES: hypothetical protein [unclassified Lysobacter]|uniref:hypothetical protein n=1 Tax=unclassified Lysobacter TaxID=2635362 RepID=UPI001BE8C1C1|nr:MULTISPECIES: hypothetical protein [unclassified Lysobacter]MBT2746045.1 hypothetical protein [Lysobacter sp. ISL-42]MBT2752480.1 hypothetical protein [Lysobacter sp. ISL-50]MBT2776791.1 hypothetical protein [Lysobacter sp. ISL-54]MBT2780641.1 hypothetical protein [Lysobacter sp. ISL-52]